MTFSSRTLLNLLVPVALSACAAAPPREHKVVDVSAGTLTPEYSSINARVLTEAASVDHTFVASLDRGKRAADATAIDVHAGLRRGRGAAARRRQREQRRHVGYGSALRRNAVRHSQRRARRCHRFIAACDDRRRRAADRRGRAVRLGWRSRDIPCAAESFRRSLDSRRRPGRMESHCGGCAGPLDVDRRADDREHAPGRTFQSASARCGRTTRSSAMSMARVCEYDGDLRCAARLHGRRAWRVSC